MDLRTDLDRQALNKAAVEFMSKLETYDAVLLFYAGHGFQVNGNDRRRGKRQWVSQHYFHMRGRPIIF